MMQSKPARSFETALLVGAWAVGAFIYGWLCAGLLNERDYPSLTLSSALDISDLGFALVSGVVVGGAAWFFRRKKTSNSDFNRLFRIVVAVLPALFVVSALATLVLTLATYNGDWVDARQGLATAFAALIAAVGVVVSVAVSYQTGEENRLAQQENLRRQLEHQREIEDERAQREQNKQDAEIIKSLNDRLHEILSRRYSKDENERSATYFQLATLYQDWETLAASSEIVRKQKNSQQRNILKILFGVYQEKTETNNERDGVDNPDLREKPGELCEEKVGGAGSGSKDESSSRSKIDIRTLNSVIQDIFPKYLKGKEKLSEAKDKELKEKSPEVVQYSYDLSYLDLRGLDLSQRDLRHVNLKSAHLEDTNLLGTHLENANLQNAYLERTNLGEAALEGEIRRNELSMWVNLSVAHLEGADLRGAYLEGAALMGVHLEKVDLTIAHLEKVDLRGAYLDGAYLMGADLEKANLGYADLEHANLNGANLEGTDLSYAHLEDANLYATYLKDTDLRGAHLEGACLMGAELEGASFFGFCESPQGADARERVINQLKEAAHLPSRDELLKAKDFDQALVDDIIKAHKEHHRQNQQ